MKRRISTTLTGPLGAAMACGLLTAAAAEPDKSAPPAEPGERSNGIIAPPEGVDPKMQVRPPPAGNDRTPVIPPPGSRGGDPYVNPK